MLRLGPSTRAYFCPPFVSDGRTSLPFDVYSAVDGELTIILLLLYLSAIQYSPLLPTTLFFVTYYHLLMTSDKSAKNYTLKIGHFEIEKMGGNCVKWYECLMYIILVLLYTVLDGK